MPVLLHAIIAAEAVSQVDAPLRLLPTGVLAAVVAEDDPNALLHHQRVSQVCERVDACLPARFGSRFESDEALRRVLLERQEQLCAALERVRGRCELAVTAVWTDRQLVAEGEGAGTRYLRERQARQRVARELAEMVEAAAEPQELRTSLQPRDGVAVSMALLVDRERAVAVAARLGALYAREDVRILVNGPWPPYSFAEHDQREE